MSKIILILTAIVISQVAFSQEYEYVPFPDSGVIWSEVYLPGYDGHKYPEPIYERFSLNGEDTVINDIVYKKLYIFNDTIFSIDNATFIGGLREDEQKRIFFIGDTVVHEFKPMNELYGYENEIMLFDFSVNKGDTIKKINCLPEDDLLIIDKIDTILIGNTLRKRFLFEKKCCIEWIEGIGNLRGLLFTSGSLPTNGLNGDLICFEQNGKILYFNNDYSECFSALTGIETKKNDYSDIKVFPNPSNTNIIKFGFGEHRIKLIQIIDCNGFLRGDFYTEMQSEFFLSTEKYQPGIYFYRATNINGIEHTGKFVVQ